MIPLNQGELASLAATSRSSTNQALRAAEEQGIIAVGRSRVEIVDLGALAHLAR